LNELGGSLQVLCANCNLIKEITKRYT
jgi:hypothetical protein